MMARVVRAAAIQLSPVLGSRDGTVAKVVSSIGEAARAGAELCVFPETVVPYYPYFSFIKAPVAMGKDHLQLYEEAVSIPSAAVETMAAAARRHRMVVSIGVTERDGGSLYNTQLLFDSDGTLVQRRRKITPTYHERMIWGQGDGSGLRCADTAVGRVGSLACWEHYNPLARYALMADREEIHVGMFPGSMVGQIFADQIQVTIRHHALESGCFVVNATGFLTPAQVEQLAPGGAGAQALAGGCYTAIVSPEGVVLGTPLTEGEGMVVQDLDFALITKRKRMMDSVGHYSRPELLSLCIAPEPVSVVQRSEVNRQPSGLSQPPPVTERRPDASAEALLGKGEAVHVHS